MHGELYCSEIASVGDFSSASRMEFSAIDFGKDLAMDKVVNGCINLSEGYDSPKLISAAKDASTFRLYLLHTEKPFQPDFKRNGPLSMPIVPSVREASKYWSLNASINLYLQASSI